MCKCYLCCRRLLREYMCLLDLDTTISVPTKWISLHMSPQGIITILFLQRAAGLRTTNSDYFLSDRCKHSSCKCLPSSALQVLLLQTQQSKFRYEEFCFFYWQYFISSVFKHLCEHVFIFNLFCLVILLFPESGTVEYATTGKYSSVMEGIPCYVIVIVGFTFYSEYWLTVLVQIAKGTVPSYSDWQEVDPKLFSCIEKHTPLLGAS